MKGKMQMMQKMMSDPAAFVDTEMMQGITLLLAQEEEQLQESVAALVEAADTDVGVDVEDPEARSGQLRAGLKAMVNGDIPATWVRTQSDVDLEHVDEAAEFANADPDDWQAQCQEWAERWRENGLEGTDAELADAHIRSRYGVTKATFEDVVVEWDADRVDATLRELLVGPIEDVQDQIDAVTETLEDG